MVMLNKINAQKINPATEEKQDAIIAALQAGPTVELEFKNDVGNPLPVSLSSVPSHPVTNAGTFAVQEASAAAIKTSVEIMDDWDESDRAKVNIIAGQAGIDGDSGNKSAKTVRVVLATDQPLLTNPVLVQQVNANGHPNGKADFFDVTTSTTVVYEGYKSGATVYLCKIDLTAGTRTWATDTWANRVTATYA